MSREAAWSAAIAGHHVAVTEFRARVEAVPRERWHVARAEGKWSPAEEALHVSLSYEVALANLAGGPGMRLRVSPFRATLLRWLFLPQILRTGKFPRGVRAPREVRPGDEAATLTADAVLARLEHAAAAALAALQATADQRPAARFTHAYFGALRPLTGLRLLSAHTRHHARRLH